MVNILLIGNGAREHALAAAIKKSSKNPNLFSYMKSNNPGIGELSEEVKIGDYSDLESVCNFAKEKNIDFSVIGPEDPLKNGIVDELQKNKIPCVGPKMKQAMLETSKTFTRNLLKKHNIPGNPQFKSFKTIDGIKEFVEGLGEVVIKPDGLTAGKGVRVQGIDFQTADEALEYCKEVLLSHPSVIIEEKLDGEEFSLQSFTDGITVIDTPPVQDHKRAYVDDKGPNTGGMGSYSDCTHLLLFLKQTDVDEAHKITKAVIDAIKKETGDFYKGVVYGGFMLTKYGVKLIEFNVRMGDPEAMNVLSILQTDFVDLCQAIIDQKLDTYEIEFEEKATVCKYIVPKGYPDNPVKGEKITVENPPDGVNMFYSSVDKKEDGLYMTGSRAIAFVGMGYSFMEAEEMAEIGIACVKGNVFHREDIGTQELLDKRVDHMRNIL